MILISRILLKLKLTPATVRTGLITRRGFEHKLELWRWRSKHLPLEEWKVGGVSSAAEFGRGEGFIKRRF